LIWFAIIGPNGIQFPSNRWLLPLLIAPVINVPSRAQ
jgi:hypothetical protein